MEVCYEAHKGQKDHGGTPYVFHPLHLAEQMSTEDEVVTALLHDVAEDTDVTMEMLKEMGTVGVGMAVLVTGVWVGMVLVAKAIEKRPAPEPEAAEVQS